MHGQDIFGRRPSPKENVTEENPKCSRLISCTAHMIVSNAFQVKQHLHVKHVQTLNESTPLADTAAMKLELFN